MGHLIYLDEWRTEHTPGASGVRTAFFFDVTSPLSYLMAERVERKLGDVDWVGADGGLLRRLQLDVDGASVSAGHAEAERAESRPAAEHTESPRLRTRAEACARALRLPLVWPDRFPGAAPCAQRACAFACEIGAGGAFALAAMRLAFCGGFDLEDPEMLAEAAAAAGVPLEECLAAAGETWRDQELEATARQLWAHGITMLPAFRVGRHWIQGESGLLEAAALVSGAGTAGRSAAPIA